MIRYVGMLSTYYINGLPIGGGGEGSYLNALESSTY